MWARWKPAHRAEEHDDYESPFLGSEEGTKGQSDGYWETNFEATLESGNWRCSPSAAIDTSRRSTRERCVSEGILGMSDGRSNFGT